MAILGKESEEDVQTDENGNEIPNENNQNGKLLYLHPNLKQNLNKKKFNLGLNPDPAQAIKPVTDADGNQQNPEDQEPKEEAPKPPRTVNLFKNIFYNLKLNFLNFCLILENDFKNNSQNIFVHELWLIPTGLEH